MARLRERQEWDLARALWRADRRLAAGWWCAVVARGVLPAGFAVAMGAVIGAVQDGSPLTGPLVGMGVVFVLMQVLVPIQVVLGYDLGDSTAASLYDELVGACT